jgi:hypothetical protein
MDKPVRQAAPYFSQPVRQITLMLMVTVLVAVGAWVVFARILPIIIENPWLNGLIFGVFFLGIITCFLAGGAARAVGALDRRLCERAAGP